MRRPDRYTLLRRGKVAAGVALLFAVCSSLMAPIIGLQVHRNTPLSVIDEVTYTDYLFKVGHGHFIIGNGEKLGGEALRQRACRGISIGLLAPKPSACKQPLPRPAGRNTADIDPPTYYVLTYGVARVLQRLGVTHDLVTAGRLAGAVWAGSALTTVVLLCRFLLVSRGAAVVAAAAAGLTSGLVSQWQYLTPHATDLTVGGLVTLAVLAWERGRVQSWALLLAGAVPPLVKASQVEIALAVALYLLIGAFWRPAGPARVDRRRLLGGLAVLVALALSSVTWLQIRNHYALTHAVAFPFFDVRSFQPHFVLDNVGRFLLPWSDHLAPGLAALVVVWCYGVAAHTTTAPDADPALRRLSLAVLAAGAFGAVLLVASNYVLLQQYYLIPERYGFALVPAALALGATALRSRVAVATGSAVCALLLTSLTINR